MLNLSKMRIQFFILSITPLITGFLVGYFGFSILFSDYATEGIQFQSSLDKSFSLKPFEIAVSKEARYISRNHKQKRGKSLKILCIVIASHHSYESSIAGIGSTWGKKCFGLKFITAKKPSKELSKWSHNITVTIQQLLPSTKSSWNLIRETWKIAYKDWLKDYDWFLLVEDNAFIVVENLELFLSYQNSSEPTIYGHMLKKNDFKYISNAPGYVLSKEALSKLGKELNEVELSWLGGFGHCANVHIIGEISWVLGQCLDSVNVKPIDTRDSEGRLMFLPLPITYLMNLQNPRIIRTVRNMIGFSDKKFEMGLNCCSDVGIAYLESNKGYKLRNKKIHMNYMVYHLKPSGIQM